MKALKWIAVICGYGLGYGGMVGLILIAVEIGVKILNKVSIFDMADRLLPIFIFGFAILVSRMPIEFYKEIKSQESIKADKAKIKEQGQ